ncbi:MAG: hypothetical protein AAGA48_34450, partial [Myxococcota bacterium]
GLSRVLPLPDKLPPLLATSIRHADLRAVAPSLSAMEIPVSTGSSNAFLSEAAKTCARANAKTSVT